MAERIPDAVLCADAFHVAQWATAALDQVRIQAWRDARAAARPRDPRSRGTSQGRPATAGQLLAHGIQGSRYALWKTPEDFTERQHAKFAWIAATDPKLHRACLL